MLILSHKGVWYLFAIILDQASLFAADKILQVVTHK